MQAKSRVKLVSKTITVGVVAALLLSACGGEDEGRVQDDGFEYGASQEEVNTAIDGLEEVTLTFQPSSGSPGTIGGASTEAFKAAVEERSNNQITVDVMWGQSVAGFDEIPDALRDGRLDFAEALPIYDPSAWPVFNAQTAALTGLPTSPIVGEMINNSVTTELAWENDQLLEEYESLGLSVIVPMRASGASHSLCNQPIDSLDEWSGKQVRVNSASHHTVAEEIGTSPVSLDFTEMYEALQRRTIDCAFGQLHTSYLSGVPEVASHVRYTTPESAMSGRAGVIMLGGTGYNQLPTAYKQIIFDATVELQAAGLEELADTAEAAVGQVKDEGGSVAPYHESVDVAIGEANEKVLQRSIDSGLLADNFEERKRESAENWKTTIENLEYSDPGSLEDMDEWWEPGDLDFTSWAEEFHEQVNLPHRPK